MNNFMNTQAHTPIKLLLVNQKGKRFFVGKMPVKLFLKTYTVEPAEYDIYKEISVSSQYDDNDYYDHLLKQSKDAKNFQRNEDPKRISQISNFLNTEEFALFPNSIIVTCDLANDIVEYLDTYQKFYQEYSNNPEVFTNSFLEEVDNNFVLYLSNKEKSILIIDGQHRIRGLEESSDSVKADYEVIVTFILGYDRPTIAKLFYTINYTQKSVNKSQLYHLTGEFSKKLNEITFMHEVVRVLNELETSPFFKRVKMLGFAPKNILPDDKVKLTISQAFLIDYLAPTILKRSAKSIYQPIFLYYYQNEKYQIEIIRFIIKYFNAVKELLKLEWENPDNSIIVKTISIGALIKTMQILFVINFIEQFKSDPIWIKSVETEFIKNQLDGIQQIDFSQKGEFGGGASAGSLNKLKERIINKASFSSGMDYQEFIDKFKSNYLSKYQDWLTKNIN